MISEFELIQKYFSDLQTLSSGVVVGIGDDAAILDVPSNQQLVVATDTLVADVHFPADLDPYHIATRALGVNLSDMAAMGAEAKWFSLAITLPDSSADWLHAFSAGLAAVARQYRCALIGGDTTRGPLAITITVQGLVPRGEALRRAGAEIGDRVFISGELGLGAAGLALIQGRLSDCCADIGGRSLDKFYAPQARLSLGEKLRGIASSAVDISDGLVADLAHICKASGVGAVLELEKLLLLDELNGCVDKATRMRWVLSGGDDYELCFTVSEAKLIALNSMLVNNKFEVFEIGSIVVGSEVVCLDENTQPVVLNQYGYQHFS